MGLTLCVNQNNISSELTFQKAISRFNNGPTQEALALFHESLALQPNNLALKADAANEVLSNALFVTFADSLIEQCLKAEPKNAKFVAIKGRVLYTRNETLQAVKWIAEAMELGYPAKLGEEWLGDCFEKLGDKTKAKGYWNKAKAAGNDSERLKLKLLH